MARPKRFELLTPRFVVWSSTLILLSFSANRAQSRALQINTLVLELQTMKLSKIPAPHHPKKEGCASGLHHRPPIIPTKTMPKAQRTPQIAS
jgi:hypothetical protein